jgi:hypothetical protein
MTKVPLGERHHVPRVLAPGHQTVRDVCTHRPVGANHGTKRFTAVRLIYLTMRAMASSCASISSDRQLGFDMSTPF